MRPARKSESGTKRTWAGTRSGRISRTLSFLFLQCVLKIMSQMLFEPPQSHRVSLYVYTVSSTSVRSRIIFHRTGMHLKMTFFMRRSVTSVAALHVKPTGYLMFDRKVGD